MTRISTIHGIGADEYADRGKMVSSEGFIPYLSLTRGEMELWLAAQRNRIYAQWYGADAPQYAEAATMLENALNKGVHGGIKWIGAVPDYLQGVARLISKAGKQNLPAANTGLFKASRISGIGVTPPYDSQARFDACMKYASSAKHRYEADRRRRECMTMINIEKILNGGIENSGHHMVYKSIPSDFTIPQRVDIKRILHRTGVEGMALVAKLENPLMYEWVENGIIARNAQGGAGPLHSTITSFYLSQDWERLVAEIKKKGTQRPGAQINALPAVVPIIVALIGAAASAAATILKALRSEEAYAMSEARGFGTNAFSAEENDWIGGAGNPSVNSANNMLLLLGGAAALFLLNGEN